MSEKSQSNGKFDEPRDEPLFLAISKTDPATLAAYDRALASVPIFIEHIERNADALCSAKLRFRDPDESERLGEDSFLFLWLTAVHYHAEERLFSGTFFEVPPALQKWHQAAQRLAFEGDDIFDWMVLAKGHLQGGFTLRVTRDKLPEKDRGSYDRYVWVSVYEPLPS
ncbi:DUF2314 domain-containing protein [Mesorhizobium onobrychidis]|uniref:DUF2314 domain-containing protein n=1 Tax=Mesorhizobium onobrychidis TaxID=2775404 RepID=A0ABY5R4D2_9HYPH|nr:DUF2314 domain-containing protein [Mesorhizobium onobrychidis]UVC17112.1 DUF2314 domain-containing protein [Mesorhizobium onobrychidis]